MQLRVVVLVLALLGLAEAFQTCQNLPVLYNNYPMQFGQRTAIIDGQMKTGTVTLAYCAVNPTSAWWTMANGVTLEAGLMMGGSYAVPATSALGRLYVSTVPFNNLTNYQCYKTMVSIKNPNNNAVPTGDTGTIKFTVMDQYCGPSSTSVYMTTLNRPPVLAKYGLQLPSTMPLHGSSIFKVSFCMPHMMAGFNPRVAWITPAGIRLEAPVVGTKDMGRYQVYRYQDAAAGCDCSGLAPDPATCWSAFLHIQFVSMADAGTYSFVCGSSAGDLKFTQMVTITGGPTTTMGPMSTTTTMMPMNPTTSTTMAPPPMSTTTTTMGPPPTTTTTGAALPTTTTTTMAPPCYTTSATDLVVLLDISTQGNAQSLGAAKSLIENFLTQPNLAFGTNGNRLALNKFSATSSESIGFLDYTNNAARAARSVDSIKRSGSASADVVAALNTIVSSETSPGQGYRSANNNAILLILNGKNTGNQGNLGAVYNKLLNTYKFDFYAMAWTTTADSQFLTSFSGGNPDRLFKVTDNNYGATQMQQALAFINKVVCRVI